MYPFMQLASTRTSRSGGEKVMAAEVERALLSHASVAHAAVLGQPDPRLGERVVAVVVLREGAGSGSVDAERLREHCRGCLGGYKVPKEVRVVAALPMTASGKVMKARLRRQLEQQQQQEEQQQQQEQLEQQQQQQQEERRRRSFL